MKNPYVNIAYLSPYNFFMKLHERSSQKTRLVNKKHRTVEHTDIRSMLVNKLGLNYHHAPYNKNP